MQKKSVLYSPRLEELKKQKKKAVTSRVFLYSALCISIMIGLTYLSRTGSENINNINIIGNKVLDSDAMKTVVNQDLAGKYLWLFPKTNFLLYPKNKIKKDLISQFSRIQNISFALKNTTTLEIDLGERAGTSTWCGTAVPNLDEASQTCYFLDDRGYIFDNAPDFSGNVYTRFYGKDSIQDTDSPIGSYFAPDIFTKLITFKQNIEAMGLKPTMFYLADNGDISMYLPKGTIMVQGPEIRFNSTDDFDQVAENLQAALGTEPLLTDFKTKYSSLEYIDLRFGNKVYFKFANQGQTIAPTVAQ